MVSEFAITGSVEIIQVAEAVAREKGIPKESVFEALQEALVTVSKKKYGHEHNIHAEISERTGEIKLFRDREVVESAEDHVTQISLEDAKEKNADIELGGFISEPIPPIDFGRVASQTFKQVVIQKVREAEREKQYDDFKDRVGEIVTGTVKRIEYGNLIIDFGKTETIMPRDQIIPREVFRQGDRVRAYIVDVRREAKGPQIFLSRTHPGFLAQLFAQEVPEIYDGLVKIVAVARDPGSRAKCAVVSSDSSIDPVGACIGPRGARVTAVYNELQGEKIDIVEWSNDLASFAVNVLSSKTRDAVVEVQKIIFDEDRNVLEAVVADEHLSLAIGRRGQNVRLASELLGWHVDIVSETQDSERRVEEFNTVSTMFSDAMNVEEVIGQLLASEGFGTIEEVVEVEEEELLAIEGFDEDLVAELRKRAAEFIEERDQKARDTWKNLGVSEDISAMPYMTDALMATLGEGGIKTLDDLADLSVDEFVEDFPKTDLSKEEVTEMIMKAREHWFEDEDGAEEKAKSEEEIKEAV